MLSSLLLIACGLKAEPESAPADPEPPGAVAFEGVAPPASEAERRAVRSGAPGFHPVASFGDALGDWSFGQLVDAEGRPLKQECNSNDFNGLLQAHGALFLVSHFECYPGAIYLTRLNQHPVSGALSAEWTRPVDLSGVGGGGLHCAGDVTPWGTHLASEEYEPDARKAAAEGGVSDNHHGFNGMAAYFGGDTAALHPYRYGWIPEVEITSASGDTAVHKRYALGRFSHELALVMPDRRTVYLTDDGLNGGFFLFVADRAGDLSAGRLYAARWEQTCAGPGGHAEAELRWVPLGHAAGDEVERLLGEGPPAFGDLLEAAEPGEGGCPEGFGEVNTAWGRECLRVVEGMEVAASRLETRRYAALKGATTELLKSEGMAFDPESKRLFMAISKVGEGMLPGTPFDAGGPDHVRLEANPCGVIFGMDIYRGEEDTEGEVIDSAFVMGRAASVLAGAPRDDAGGDSCDLAGIANPDNLTVVEGAGLLMIAEDSSKHTNNALWAAELSRLEPLECGGQLPPEALTRAMTIPPGGEVSGLHWFPDLGGFAYLTATVQKPFSGVEGASQEERRSQAGYFGPFQPIRAESSLQPR